eukprot:TRINITY_DN1344_c0_g1_i4.p3 TRINITY_DN1344_c0_g1~~TRINITY_DN1344_c0_g1_i4.p3  ORF type:complete len:102 (-),score=1.48 TRINITY_DN1344_c0_g1_i4:94-399(-)
MYMYRTILSIAVSTSNLAQSSTYDSIIIISVAHSFLVVLVGNKVLQILGILPPAVTVTPSGWRHDDNNGILFQAKLGISCSQNYCFRAIMGIFPSCGEQYC